MQRNIYIGLGVLFAAIGGLYFSILPTFEAADTGVFRHIAQQPWWSETFWGDLRPFTVPLIFKLLQLNNALIAFFYFGLWLLSWLLLAWATTFLVQQPWIKVGLFYIVLALGLSDQIFFWNRTLLSESPSLSLFVLALALGILTAAHPQARRHCLLFTATVCTIVLWSFTRDTNPYTILAMAILGAIWLVWKQKPGAPTLAIGIVIAAAALFWVQSYTAERGERWQFPLVNVIAARILPDPDATRFFSNHGMPTNPEVMRFTNLWASVYTWEGFGDWLPQHGKSTYMRYLLATPLQSVIEPFKQWRVIYNQDLRDFYAQINQDYSNQPQAVFTTIAWSKGYWFLTQAGLTVLVAAWAIHQRGMAPLAFGLILVASALPGAFVVWHGDAMEIARHAVGVSAHMRLALWLVLFLSLDLLIQKSKAA